MTHADQQKAEQRWVSFGKAGWCNTYKETKAINLLHMEKIITHFSLELYIAPTLNFFPFEEYKVTKIKFFLSYAYAATQNKMGAISWYN